MLVLNKPPLFETIGYHEPNLIKYCAEIQIAINQTIQNQYST